MAQPVVRRQILQAGLAWAAVGLGGCGFALRRAPTLAFSRWAVLGHHISLDSVQAVSRELNPAAERVNLPWQAQLCVLWLDDTDSMTAAGSDANALVNAVSVRLAWRYALVLPPSESQWQAYQAALSSAAGSSGRHLDVPHGGVQVAEQVLRATRSLTYNETQALAKREEQRALVVSMRQELARSLAQRMAQWSPR